MAGPTTLRIRLAMPALSLKTLRSKQQDEMREEKNNKAELDQLGNQFFSFEKEIYCQIHRLLNTY